MGADSGSPFVTYDDRNNPVRTEPTMDMVLGNTPGRRSNSSFGFNAVIASSTMETVQAAGGTWEPDDTLETISFASASVLDAAGGGGAFRIIIRGIDENWEEYEDIEILTLLGTTPVFTIRPYKFIIRVTIVAAGASRVNAGVISGTGVTTGFTKSYVPAGYGITQSAVVAVPEGKWCLVDDIEGSVLRTNGITGSSVFQVIWHNFRVTDGYEMIVWEQKTNGLYNDLVRSFPWENQSMPPCTITTS